MIKVFFVLVMSVYHGGISTGPQFTTMQQCEAAKALVLKCKIGNNFSYKNEVVGSTTTKVMNGYPYPETVECVEE